MDCNPTHAGSNPADAFSEVRKAGVLIGLENHDGGQTLWGIVPLCLRSMTEGLVLCHNALLV